MATKPDIKRRPPRRRRSASPAGRRKPATDLLRSIATSLSALYGKNYFHSLTQYLTNTLGMEYAFVGELARDRKDTVNIVSACFAGKILDDFSYSLIDTPCQHIISRGACAYPRKVQKLFPKDRYLADIGAECYVGIPLFGSSGQPLGLISVIGRQPLRDRDTVESLLQVVAARTATELERQRLYQELGESYRTLTTLMANLPGLVYRCRNDKDWSMEFISEGCRRLTGYAPDDFVKRRAITYGELIHANDRESVWSEVQAALKQNRSFQLVYRITAADGKMKWVWEQGRGVFSPQGELLALEGFITDITERKRADEALLKSESRLRSIVQTALNVIIVLSPEHRILEFNPEAERVYGRRREEVLGQDYFDLFLPHDLWKTVDDDLRMVMTGKGARGFENTIRAADGGKRNMIWNVSRLDDAVGQAVGIVAIGHDITEQRRTEETLRRNEQLLRNVMETLPVGVWIADREGKIISGNEAGKRIWAGAKYVGIEQYGEYKGWWADTGKPIAPEEWAVARAVMKGETSLNEVVDIQCFDGTRKTILNSAIPLRGSDGGITGAFIVNQDITEQRRAEAALRESEARLKEAQRIAHVGSWELDLVSDRLAWSDEICRIFEIDPQRFSPSYEAFLDAVHPDDRESVNRAYTESVKNRVPYDITHRLQMPDGRIKYVHERCVNYYSEQGAPLRSTGTVQDITGRKRGEEMVARLGRVLDSSSNEIYVFDAATLRFVQVNEGARRNLGYSMEQLAELTPFDIKPEYTRETFEAQLAPLRYRETEVLTFETVLRRKDGSRYPVEVRMQLFHAENPPVFVAVITDITDRMEAREQLQFLAHHDALTNLPNRALFLERLDHALTRARWTKRPLAVLFLDLDRFKNINDTLGHDIGDSTLRVAAKRLTNCVREGDTVARFGGDEFTVLLEDLANSDDVPSVAQKILEALSRPFDVEGREFVVTTSIGISLYPSDGDDSLKLLRNADTAMYRAKEQGRNKYQFYSSEMSAKALEKFMLESSLRYALERQEFLLYYQPQVNLATGKVTGVEALLRWQHPELGLVSPTQFIPVAEETGLMKFIDEWVLRTACAQGQAWRSAGLPPLTMIVNLSGRTFNEPRMMETVSQALANSCFAPGMLELEITESVLMHNAQATVEMLEQLNRMGLKLAVDDFGTGYSSLSYLKRFPIHTLKIDQSFVRDVTSEADDASLVTAIIAMGHALQLNVIAEGVETPEQLDFLRRHGCDGIQGYLFSRPLPAEEITRLLQSGKKL
jgi:diguanylate cyclase (GGDEF)-like protein/PAS domain S-box-containing protein